MLALPPLSKKPKSDDKEIKQFRSKVAEDQRALKDILKQRLQQAEKKDSSRREQFTSLITEALQTRNRETHCGVSTFPKATIADSPILSSARRISAACESLLQEYTAYEAMVANMAGENTNPLTEMWEGDIEKTERLLRIGHKTAVKNVKKLLGAEQGDAVEDIEGDGEEQLNYELVRGLRNVERGVKRMVKGLPREEME